MNEIRPSGAVDFRRRVEEHSQEVVSRCYQCDKCVTGCPMSERMEFYPNQLFRLIQLGDEKRVLVSNTMWLCLCCYTCSVRCPNDIDIAKVMDSLRMIALAQGYSSPFPQALAFHQVFLNCVRRYGKVNEVELMLRYNLRLRKPFQRLLLGLTMLSKGRLEILPRRIKGRKELHQIFENKGG